MPSNLTPQAFVDRWAPSGGGEKANYTMFLSELCDLLDVPRPDVSTAQGQGAYVFEREVREHFTDGTSAPRFIDLYRRGSFVLEAKQGVEAQEVQEAAQRALSGKQVRKKGHGVRGTRTWDAVMVRAKAQAEAYAKFLPAEERPPFLIIVDVGHVIELYAEFTRTGGTYLPYPNARTHRIPLDALLEEETRALLRAVWLDPQSLDTSRRSAAATREVAARLAALGQSLEAVRDDRGKPAHSPNDISTFLMRLIFTMFAEDMNFIPRGKFAEALVSLRGQPEGFVSVMQELWSTMAHGGYSAFLRAKVLHFNGGLFENVTVLPLTGEQLELVITAAGSDWSHVEPSIFGTLVERALNPEERHRLGAHYTPRAYVERLVNQVIVAPLREEWEGVLVEVQAELAAAGAGESPDAEDSRKAREKAVSRVERYLAGLHALKVLDPACGTGNFLYVSMELIKVVEAEVTAFLLGLGGQAPLAEIGPEGFLGLEINERAASVASLVLWIGYLQIYARHHAQPAPPEPLLRSFKNIRCTDAVLTYKKRVPAAGKSRWDGVTRRTDPVSGRLVPDVSARVQDFEYHTPNQAVWPSADFIVGNPPFLGSNEMRETLGDGYVDALRGAYKITKKHAGVPDSADFVMYWWFKAAQQMSIPRLRRFGFVSTNSIKQTNARKVIDWARDEAGLSLVYAVPDHPWVDEADGAAVRIAMTAAERGKREGLLETVVSEEVAEHGEYGVQTVAATGVIYSNLRVDVDLTETVSLRSMEGLSNRGVQLLGEGFIVTPEEAAALGLGRVEGLEGHIREYRNGRDVNQVSRGVMVIDLYGLSETDVRERFPEVYQHVTVAVKPERDQNNRRSYREKWWVFGEPRNELRAALQGLKRFIVTVETSKHRTFQFLDSVILPDNKLVVIASDDAYVLGILQSRIHVQWSLAKGGTLEDRPVYSKSDCFETFPFPDAEAKLREAIRQKAEALDAHRKARQALHPALTITGMYNVLEKVRAGTELTAVEREVVTQGLVVTLGQLHDELDDLVQRAYGWSGEVSTLDILSRLAGLNAERAALEREGNVLYLRPEFQNPRASRQALMLDAEEEQGVAVRPVFPRRLAEQSQAVRALLRARAQPLSARQVAGHFRGVGPERAEEVLEMLVALGQARDVPGGGGYTA